MISLCILLVILTNTIDGSLGFPPHQDRYDFRGDQIPPDPHFVGIFREDHDREKIQVDIKNWRPENSQNLWELSGLYEGDIMFHSIGSDTKISKNGLSNSTLRWTSGIVPYYIKVDDFNEKQIEIIKGAFKEYHNKTCLRFVPYKTKNEDYIEIQSKEAGCWSYVGRHGNGQVINLQNPGCIRHGTVVHELMHAVGFYHQQSATDRDEWIDIHWENIEQDKKHNFKKYDDQIVTDFGISYDYGSVMHYSNYAFSRNGKPTITAKEKDIQLGQRKGLSKKDVEKLRKMYREECFNRQLEETVIDFWESTSFDEILD